jgi:hypothetical protein
MDGLEIKEKGAQKMKPKGLRKFTWAILLTTLICSCSSLRREARFYAKHPELIPKITKAVTVTKTVNSDTLKGSVPLTTKPTKKKIVFENSRNKTTVSITPNEAQPDSFRLDVQTIAKPLIIKIDTAFDYRSMVFTPPEKNNLFKQLDSLIVILLATFCIGFIVLIISWYRKHKA